MSGNKILKIRINAQKKAAWLRNVCFTLGDCLISVNFVLKIQYDTDVSCDMLCNNIENYSGV